MGITVSWSDLANTTSTTRHFEVAILATKAVVGLLKVGKFEQVVRPLSIELNRGDTAANTPLTPAALLRRAHAEGMAVQDPSSYEDACKAVIWNYLSRQHEDGSQWNWEAAGTWWLHDVALPVTKYVLGPLRFETEFSPTANQPGFQAFADILTRGGLLIEPIERRPEADIPELQAELADHETWLGEIANRTGSTEAGPHPEIDNLRARVHALRYIARAYNSSTDDTVYQPEPLEFDAVAAAIAPTVQAVQQGRHAGTGRYLWRGLEFEVGRFANHVTPGSRLMLELKVNANNRWWSHLIPCPFMYGTGASARRHRYSPPRGHNCRRPCERTVCPGCRSSIQVVAFPSSSAEH
ncbi:hypothetical protein D5S17_36070 [Pseudonocardiaceae bacterium YIM PH 21723]|nr:hypothetical protein D5S17_36070 [Pseudonocardiaceae bacterium YIM PH 21723]